MKMPQTQSLRTPRRRLCASLRNRNAHVTRAFLRENLQEKCRAQDRDEQFARACTETFYKSHFMRDFTGKVPRPKIAITVCASLRIWNAHGEVTCRAPEFRCTFCASLRSRNALVHLSRPDQMYSWIPPERSKLPMFPSCLPSLGSCFWEELRWNYKGLPHMFQTLNLNAGQETAAWVPRCFFLGYDTGLLQPDDDRCNPATIEPEFVQILGCLHVAIAISLTAADGSSLEWLFLPWASKPP